MYELLGISLCLAGLLAINSLASALTDLVWRVVARPACRSWRAKTRARVLFALRVLPSACALIFVLVLVTPAYLAYAPRATAEEVSPKLALVALIAVAGIGLAACP